MGTTRVQRRFWMAVVVVALAGARPTALTAGQGASNPPNSASQLPPEISETFLGFDIFGGVVTLNPYQEVGPWPTDGWEAGGTVNFLRWFGVAASFGRTSRDDVRLVRYLVGPQVTTPYGFSNGIAVRGFAHALVGGVNGGRVDTASDSAAEFVLGGGFDLLLLRMQFDYVNHSIAALKKNDLRLFIGGVVPLCLRQCRENDGFNLSGRSTQR